MTIHLLYFARLREVFDLSSESLTLADQAWQVSGLLEHLRARGGVWASELAADKIFRIAINQQIASLDSPLPPDAEVAIFPPVTGG